MAALFCACLVCAAPPADPLTRAKRVLAATPLIDGHNDLPWIIRARFNSSLAAVDLASDTSHLKPPADQAPMMTDLPRLRAGQVGAQFWSVYVPVEMQGPVAVEATLEQIDIVRQMVARYPR
ncbi:MAG TPA: membrane dipeptidase, partial [Steroidobacteraceae bacterium]|nr:membrane dipeptidase [Steroidobacteraceae bacterium]